MKEYYSFNSKLQKNNIDSELSQTIRNLLDVKIKRLKVKESTDFLKDLNKYESYLTMSFKEKLKYFFENDLGLDSSLGLELKSELKEIKKYCNAENADYEIVDNSKV